MAEESHVTKQETPQVTAERVQPGPTFSPRVDIVEKEDAMIVLADMPGVSREGVDVELDRGVLTIDGEVAPMDEEKLALQWREYDVGCFHRKFEVGEGLDPTRVEATIKDGVLRLVIPKREEIRRRKIEITGD